MDTHGIYARHGADHTTTASSDASGMAMDGMDGMDGGHSAGMMSVFQTIRATPLYSTAWTPNSTGTYAATCIFLIVLAALLRVLLAAKQWQEIRWLDQEVNRRYVVVNGKGSLAENLSRDSLAKQGNLVLSENGVEENVVVVKKHTSGPRPWRLSVDPVRAVIDTVIAGVGYLLMLAVMTMNVGYFLSILAGTFLGSLLVGRFITIAEH